MSPANRPLLDFMIVGAQKSGTTALAHYLAQHPRIRMSSVKEPHLFDAPDYSPDWTPAQIDERYRPYFEHAGESPADAVSEVTPASTESTPSLAAFKLLHGEATPIYLFLPEIAPQLRRYNADLKLIVLLRDPAERAISHYYMEKNKGYEGLPLGLALTIEPFRLRQCRDRRRHGSAWRRHSYRRRGLYSLQLRNLYRYFDARQVLLVRTDDLARNHEGVLRRVFEFLDAGPCKGIPSEKVFEGERGGRRHLLVSWLLRVTFLPEFVRMRRFRIDEARV